MTNPERSRPYGPDPREVKRLVRLALREDVGSGDLTTATVVGEDVRGVGRIIAVAPGVVAGMPVVLETFRQTSPLIRVDAEVADGDDVEAGRTLATVLGPASGILTGERVALNFLQRLSGIATLTARFVTRVGACDARIADTRKTTPGLRALEKYAVRVGGGCNHRMGLYDAVMIKDNHIAAAGGIAAAVARARARVPHTTTVTVECETLHQVDEAVQSGADVILLDNMDNAARAEAVRQIAGRALTEASGGVSLQNVAAVAASGVNIISVGALTHSAPALDIRLDLTVEAP